MLDIVQGFLITLLVFVPLEHILPRKADKKIFRDKWALDTLYASIGALITASLSFVIIFVGVVLLSFIYMPTENAPAAQLPLFVQVICIIILADIGYYTMHRLSHAVPFLWRLHAVHHSIEQMDWLAAHRVHPLDQALTRGVSLILPFALGFSAPAMAIFAGLFSWHSYLKHSNVKITFGPLRWLFATPTYHHWHHSNEPHAYNTNFAGQLPLMDILFRTAIMEEKKGPKIYGCDTPVSDNFASQLVDPFRLNSQAREPMSQS